MQRHPARLHATCYVGSAPIFLTIVTHRRRPYFTHAPAVDVVLSQFLQAGTRHMFAMTAYCFMPDHLHALVSRRAADADFQRFVRIAKQRSSYHFDLTACGRLWHPSFFDRTLRTGESVRDAMRYIVMNPVRAGLVADPREYAFWGSETFEREAVLEYVGETGAPRN